MKNSLLYLLLLVCNCCLAQTPSLTLYGGPSYTFTSAPPSLRGHSDFVNINDSLAMSLHQIKEVAYEITDKIGFDLGVQLNFPISSKFKINTGLGLELIRYDLTRVYGENISPNSITDTLFLIRNAEYIPQYDPITELVSANDICDEIIVEESGPPRETNQATQHRLLYFQIPINLEFKLNDRFSFWAGMQASALLQAPFPYAQSDRSHHIELDDNGGFSIICTDNRSYQSDRSGNGFNNLLFEAQFGFNFWLNQRLGFTFKGAKLVNNIYAKGLTNRTIPSLNSFVNDAQINRYRVSLSFFYKLWTAPSPIDATL